MQKPLGRKAFTPDGVGWGGVLNFFRDKIIIKGGGRSPRGRQTPRGGKTFKTTPPYPTLPTPQGLTHSKPDT